MKKIILAILLAASAALASAQTVPIVMPWDAAITAWDGGTVGLGAVTPYSGTPAQGDFLYFNGTNWVSLGKPANGTYSINFAGAGVPSWTAGGGGLADPGGNGIVARTALNTTINRTIVCADTYCSWTNGDGVAGAPSFTLSVTPGHEGGAVALQASTPGTQQTGNDNLAGVGIREKSGIAAVVTDAFILQNTTAATGGAQVQDSPALHWIGHGWGNGTTDQVADFRCYNLPVAASPMRFTWNCDAQLAGGGYSNAFQMSVSGACCSAWTLTSGGNVSAAVGGKLGWSTSTQIANNSDGNASLTTNAGATSTSVWKAGSMVWPGANGQQVLLDPGAAARSEALTLSTGGTTTATAGNLVPAACKLIAVMGRVTTTITTATAFTVKVTGGNVLQQIGTASTTSNVTLTSGTTYTWVPNAFADQYYTSANTLTVTTTGTPGAGAIRFTVVCESFTPPTS